MARFEVGERYMYQIATSKFPFIFTVVKRSAKYVTIQFEDEVETERYFIHNDLGESICIKGITEMDAWVSAFDRA